MSSLVTNLNSSTVQEIVNWVTTPDGCVHSADTTQLDFAVGKVVQTRLNSTAESRRRRRCVLGIWGITVANSSGSPETAGSRKEQRPNRSSW